jgi:hypothetical protein
LPLFPRGAGAVLSDAGCPGHADGTISALGDERQAQTFTALRTGALTRASIEINKGSLLQQGDFVLQILEVGGGGTPTDTALASATIPDESVPQGGAAVAVSFANPPTVVAGHGYAIAIGRPGNLTTFSVHTRSGNPCGGEIFHNTGDGWGLEAGDADFVFQTYVQPTNRFAIVGKEGKLFARVPGPGTIVVDDVSTVRRAGALPARRRSRRRRDGARGWCNAPPRRPRDLRDQDPALIRWRCAPDSLHPRGFRHDRACSLTSDGELGLDQ